MRSQPADIEVGRHALRTFRVDKPHRALLPISAEGIKPTHTDLTVWRDGVCVARCDHGRPHESPADECSCGIYGTLDLASLRSQYPLLASNIVAVVAAEGPTIIGDEGLRTQAARVVGYWCNGAVRLQDAREILAEQCPSATSFSHLEAMLAHFGLPAVSGGGKGIVRDKIGRRATPRGLTIAATYGVLTRLSGILRLLAVPLLLACLFTQFASVLPPLAEFIIALLGGGAVWSTAYFVVRGRDILGLPRFG